MKTGADPKKTPSTKLILYFGMYSWKTPKIHFSLDVENNEPVRGLLRNLETKYFWGWWGWGLF